MRMSLKEKTRIFLSSRISASYKYIAEEHVTNIRVARGLYEVTRLILFSMLLHKYYTLDKPPLWLNIAMFIVPIRDREKVQGDLQEEYFQLIEHEDV